MHLTTIWLHELGLPPRIPVRPPHLMQPGFEEQFEYQVLFYDVFFRDGCLHFVGPSLLNLERDLVLQRIAVGGVVLSDAHHVQVKQTPKVFAIRVPSVSPSLRIGDRTISVEDRSGFTQGGKVFYTLQKDNEVEWLVDWIRINTRLHSPDRFIIYDNGSSRYGLDELRAALDVGEVSVEVHSFPFRYGPAAGPGRVWDSDFLQYALFEHVRRTYFSDSGILVNSDIDELFLARPIFELPRTCGAFAVKFPGAWAFLEAGTTSDVARFADHRFYEQAATCPCKWVLDISQLSEEHVLQVHDVTGPSFARLWTEPYFHFRSINTNWKYHRGRGLAYDPSVHVRFSDAEVARIS